MNTVRRTKHKKEERYTIMLVFARGDWWRCRVVLLHDDFSERRRVRTVSRQWDLVVRRTRACLDKNPRWLFRSSQANMRTTKP